MKKIVILFLFLSVVSGLFAQQKLDWSMALVKENIDIPFSKPVEMKDGERFSIIIRNDQECYAYIILVDSEKQMMVLLDRRLKADEQWQTSPMKLTPPSGTETFYVVMSLLEQKDLKKAIDVFNKENNTRTVRNLNTAVMDVRREASRFKENPEKPLNLGGSSRGIESNIMEFSGGTEFSGAEVYVKTIVINH